MGLRQLAGGMFQLGLRLILPGARVRQRCFGLLPGLIQLGRIQPGQDFASRHPRAHRPSQPLHMARLAG